MDSKFKMRYLNGRVDKSEINKIFFVRYRKSTKT